MDLPAGQRRSCGNAVFLLSGGTAFDFPAIHFLDGCRLKLRLRLPVGIQLAEQINEDASSNDWER
jgi:hypothetical protein